MTQEIIYTSAVRGLKMGSKGFCTVASTRNMSKPLAERLESLSGYRHLYPPGDAKNPITFSHVILTIAGKRYHVLSRVADAGYDYSKRSNKIAHHIALTQQETVSAGPAWLLNQRDFMETTWSGEPRFFETERVVSQERCEPRVCETWQRLAGDAGWGGVLAESVWSKSQIEVYVIYKEGIDILGLMLESQALLPEQSRWMATFTTNYTKLLPHVECRWRCVLESSEEVAKIRRMRHVTVIDLSQPLGPPPAGAAVDAARTGQVIGGRRTESPPAIGDVGMDVALATYAETKGSPAMPVAPPPREAEIRLAQPDTPPPRALSSPAPLRLGAMGRTRSRFYRITAMFLLAVSLLVVVAGTAYYFGVRRGTPDQIVAENEAGTDRDLDRETKTQPGESTGEIESTEGDDEGSDGGTNSVTNVPEHREQETVTAPKTTAAKTVSTQAGEENGKTSKTDLGEEEAGNDKPDAKDPDSQESHSGGSAAEDTPESPSVESAEVDTVIPPKVPGVTTDADNAKIDSRLPDPATTELDKRQLDMPEMVELFSSRTVGSAAKVRIGSMGKCTNPSLKLLHPDFLLNHEEQTGQWSLHHKDHRDSDPVGKFWIDDQRDHALMFSDLSIDLKSIPEIKKGTLYVKCDDCRPALVRLRKAKVATIELRLSKQQYEDDDKVKKPIFDPNGINMSTVILQGYPVSDAYKSQLDAPRKEVTIPLLIGETYPLEIRVVCSPLIGGHAGLVQAEFYRKNTAYTRDMRMDFFRNYESQLLECNRTLALKKKRRGELESGRSRNEDQRERDISRLRNEEKDIEMRRKELIEFRRFFEFLRGRDAAITITVTLCHRYDDDIAIPVTEDEID